VWKTDGIGSCLYAAVGAAWNSYILQIYKERSTKNERTSSMMDDAESLWNIDASFSGGGDGEQVSPVVNSIIDFQTKEKESES
jgi:hypothetical protein